MLNRLKLRYLVLVAFLEGLLTLYLMRGNHQNIQPLSHVTSLTNNVTRRISELRTLSHFKINVSCDSRETPLQSAFNKLNVHSISEVPVRIDISYGGFQLKVPYFAEEQDKGLFERNQIYAKDLNPWPKSRLKGIIEIIPGGTFARPFNCGWQEQNADFFRQERPGSNHYKVLIPLPVPESYAFQHFFDGLLPKIIQIYEILKLPDVKLLIDEPRGKFVMETLDRLNLRNKVVFGNVDTYSADFMIFACVAPPMHPNLMHTARLLLGAPEKLPVPSKEAYVTLARRPVSDNGGRYVNNENEIEEYLKNRYGDRLVIFSGKLNLTEAIELFGKTKILIAVHGGALCNIYFASRDTHVVEIMPTDKAGRIIPFTLAHTVYWQLAQMLGQRYWRLPLPPDTRKGDVTVDRNKLALLLDKLEKMPSSNTDK